MLDFCFGKIYFKFGSEAGANAFLGLYISDLDNSVWTYLDPVRSGEQQGMSPWDLLWPPFHSSSMTDPKTHLIPLCSWAETEDCCTPKFQFETCTVLQKVAQRHEAMGWNYLNISHWSGSLCERMVQGLNFKNSLPLSNAIELNWLLQFQTAFLHPLPLTDWSQGKIFFIRICVGM